MIYTSQQTDTDWIMIRTESEFQSHDNLRKTEFKYLIDRTIRLNGTTTCMVVETTNAITFTLCFEDVERCFYDEDTNQIISGDHLQCLTHCDTLTNGWLIFLGVRHCEDDNQLQKWIFETGNKNPDIIDNNGDWKKATLSQLPLILQYFVNY